MKKAFVFIFTAVVLVSFVFSEEYDIRKLRWGMSFEEVQKIEALEDVFYKQEDLLGMTVEILFGIGGQGLYSVTYSTREREFAGKAGELLKKKYGDPKTDLDYSFLVKSKNILAQYPAIVLQIYEKNDFSKLDTVKSTDATVNVKKIIKAGLSKRSMWEYGNTVALLLNSPEGIVLSYWSKAYHYENKRKFDKLIAELKQKAKKEAKEKAKDADKF
jgi:hypothetical protein